MTSPTPPTHPDVTGATVLLGPSRVTRAPVTSLHQWVRALWCAFLSGLG